MPRRTPKGSPLKRTLVPLKKKASEPIEPPKPPQETEWLVPMTAFDSYEKARTFKDQVENNIKLARYQRLIGMLVEKEKVDLLAAHFNRFLASALQAMVDRSAGELAALTDPRQVRAFLQARLAETFVHVKETWVMPAEVLERDLVPEGGLVSSGTQVSISR